MTKTRKLPRISLKSLLALDPCAVAQRRLDWQRHIARRGRKSITLREALALPEAAVLGQKDVIWLAAAFAHAHAPALRAQLVALADSVRAGNDLVSYRANDPIDLYHALRGAFYEHGTTIEHDDAVCVSAIASLLVAEGWC